MMTKLVKRLRTTSMRKPGSPLLDAISPPIYRQVGNATDAEPKEKYMKFPRGYMSKTKKFQSLKANIIAGSNQISHRLLLIPTLMIFPSLFCVLLMILEVYLHVRCHKKNKMLNDPNLYYRSPFHCSHKHVLRRLPRLRHSLENRTVAGSKT